MILFLSSAESLEKQTNPMNTFQITLEVTNKWKAVTQIQIQIQK